MAALLQEKGYTLRRHYFVMSRDLAQSIAAPKWPVGLEVRPATREHLRAVWDAIEEAFLDHWGFSPHSEEDYQAWLNLPDLDPSLWVVAWDGQQVAGVAVNFIFRGENETLGRRWAWTEPLCVRRPWRRLGLGRALLEQSMLVMRARGMQCAALEVDTENPNQALHVYQSCGYRSERRWDLYRKELE